MKLELQKWKEDAKKAWYEGKFSNENLPPLASIHIANACPKNFIKLIEKLERYESLLKQSFYLFEGLIYRHEAYAQMAAMIHREMEQE